MAASKCNVDGPTVVRLLREERSKQRFESLDELRMYADVDGSNESVLSVGLKLRDSSGKLYTVRSIAAAGAVLEDPADGRQVSVSRKEIEDDFDLA